MERAFRIIGGNGIQHRDETSLDPQQNMYVISCDRVKNSSQIFIFDSQESVISF